MSSHVICLKCINMVTGWKAIQKWSVWALTILSLKTGTETTSVCSRMKQWATARPVTPDILSLTRLHRSTQFFSHPSSIIVLFCFPLPHTLQGARWAAWSGRQSGTMFVNVARVVTTLKKKKDTERKQCSCSSVLVSQRRQLFQHAAETIKSNNQSFTYSDKCRKQQVHLNVEAILLQ